MAAFRISKLAPERAMRGLSLALCLLAAGAVSAQYESEAAKDGTLTRYQSWEVRYGIAGKPVVSDDLSRLIGEVETFAVDVLKSKDEASGESRVFGTGEAHGLFAVSPEAAAAIVVDYPNIKAISSASAR